jgi:predicted ABC-type ATPase
MLRLTREYIESGTSFSIETTLAGRTWLAFLQTASEQHFFVRLIYICLDSPERCIQRVRERVTQGGHDVPDQDVRRRYSRSLSNIPIALRFVDQGIVYENSESTPQKMLEVRAGLITWRGRHEPAWVIRLIEEMGKNSVRSTPGRDSELK